MIWGMRADNGYFLSWIDLSFYVSTATYLPSRVSAAWLASPPDADSAASISPVVASGQISSKNEEAVLIYRWELY